MVWGVKNVCRAAARPQISALHPANISSEIPTFGLWEQTLDSRVPAACPGGGRARPDPRPEAGQRNSFGFMWKVFRKARKKVEYSEKPTCSAAFMTGMPVRMSSPARRRRFWLTYW